MTTIEKIANYLHANSPQPKDANSIAEGINVSVSTVRKNLKRMRDDASIQYEKDGNSTVYWLAQAENGATIDAPETEPAQVENIEPQPEPQPSEAVPTFSRASEPETAPTVVVNTKTSYDQAPRTLIEKLTLRVKKHKARANDSTLPRHKRRQHRMKAKQRQARLDTLLAQHAS